MWGNIVQGIEGAAQTGLKDIGNLFHPQPNPIAGFPATMPALPQQQPITQQNVAGQSAQLTQQPNHLPAIIQNTVSNTVNPAIDTYNNFIKGTANNPNIKGNLPQDIQHAIGQTGQMAKNVGEGVGAPLINPFINLTNTVLHNMHNEYIQNPPHNIGDNMKLVTNAVTKSAATPQAADAFLTTMMAVDPEELLAIPGAIKGLSSDAVNTVKEALTNAKAEPGGLEAGFVRPSSYIKPQEAGGLPKYPAGTTIEFPKEGEPNVIPPDAPKPGVPVYNQQFTPPDSGLTPEDIPPASSPQTEDMPEAIRGKKAMSTYKGLTNGEKMQLKGTNMWRFPVQDQSAETQDFYHKVLARDIPGVTPDAKFKNLTPASKNILASARNKLAGEAPINIQTQLKPFIDKAVEYGKNRGIINDMEVQRFKDMGMAKLSNLLGNTGQDTIAPADLFDKKPELSSMTRGVESRLNNPNIHINQLPDEQKANYFLKNGVNNLLSTYPSIGLDMSKWGAIEGDGGIRDLLSHWTSGQKGLPSAMKMGIKKLSIPFGRMGAEAAAHPKITKGLLAAGALGVAGDVGYNMRGAPTNAQSNKVAGSSNSIGGQQPNHGIVTLPPHGQAVNPNQAGTTQINPSLVVNSQKNAVYLSSSEYLSSLAKLNKVKAMYQWGAQQGIPTYENIYNQALTAIDTLNQTRKEASALDPHVNNYKNFYSSAQQALQNVEKYKDSPWISSYLPYIGNMSDAIQGRLDTHYGNLLNDLNIVAKYANLPNAESLLGGTPAITKSRINNAIKRGNAHFMNTLNTYGSQSAGSFSLPTITSPFISPVSQTGNNQNLPAPSSTGLSHGMIINPQTGNTVGGMAGGAKPYTYNGNQWVQQ